MSTHSFTRFFRKFGRSLVDLPPTAQASILTLVIVGGSLLIPGFVRETTPARLHRANLYFLNVPTVAVGQVFPVELRVKTNGTPLNAMGFTIAYNPRYLEVLSMTTENSFCTFYLDNGYNNQKGEIKVSCGIPSPGFLGDSLAVRVTMRGNIAGTPALVINPDTAKLLANDGKGSNIIKDTPKLTLNLQQL